MQKKRKSSQQCLFVIFEPMFVKASCKLLMKLTQGVNFIMFYLQLLLVKIPKAQNNSQVINVFFFLLLGSACIKAAIKMLVKLTLSVNFTNILQPAFFVQKFFCKAFLYLRFGSVIMWLKSCS